MRFRQYLLNHFTGDTPANYFSGFKRVLKAATKEEYYRTNPCEDVKAKAGKNKKPKENMEVPAYIQFLNAPRLNEKVKEAFVPR